MVFLGPELKTATLPPWSPWPQVTRWNESQPPPSTLEEWFYFYTMDYVWTSIDFHRSYEWLSFQSLFHFILISYLLILIWYVLNCFRHEARGIPQVQGVYPCPSDWQVAVLLRLVDRTCRSLTPGQPGRCHQKHPALCSTELSSELKPDRILRFWRKSGHFWLIGWTRSRLILQSLDRILPKASHNKKTGKRKPFNDDAFTFQTKSEPECWTTILFSSRDLRKLLLRPREKHGWHPCVAPQSVREGGNNLMVTLPRFSAVKPVLRRRRNSWLIMGLRLDCTECPTTSRLR